MGDVFGVDPAHSARSILAMRCTVMGLDGMPRRSIDSIHSIKADSSVEVSLQFAGCKSARATRPRRRERRVENGTSYARAVAQRLGNWPLWKAWVARRILPS